MDRKSEGKVTLAVGREMALKLGLDNSCLTSCWTSFSEGGDGLGTALATELYSSRCTGVAVQIAEDVTDGTICSEGGGNKGRTCIGLNCSTEYFPWMIILPVLTMAWMLLSA